MKKILCPTDFSDAAHNGIEFAAHFAQRTGAGLFLYNVQSLFQLAPGEMLSVHPPTVEKARHILETQSEEIASSFSIPCHSEVQVSDDSLSSVISARGKEFDLVIMGTNGPDDLYQFFFGTNTYQVIRKSGLPLIFVPEMIKFSFIKRIIFAYDYLHRGVPRMQQFQDLMKSFDAEVRFLQLTKRELTEDEQVLKARHKMEIEYALQDDFKVSFENIVAQDFSSAIQHYMLKSDADLLVLSTHPYSLGEKLFHKSLAKRISMDFMYPAMIIHE